MQGATSHAEFDDGLIVSQPPTKIWEAELKENVIVAIVLLSHDSGACSQRVYSTTESTSR
jgi:hypothetical protein